VGEDAAIVARALSERRQAGAIGTR
jgi:hypothetical protein